MMRQAAGELPPARRRHASTRAAHRSRCASTPKIPAEDFRPSSGPADGGGVARRRARRDLGREPAPRSRPSTIRCWPRSSSTARRARRRIGKLAGGARRDADRRHRDQSRLSAAIVALRRCSRAARCSTRTLAELRLSRRARIEVLAPGTQTTVQDWPGRLGYWDVGVPPSGPMDALSLPPRQPAASAIPKAPRASRCTLSRPDAALQPRRGRSR